MRLGKPTGLHQQRFSRHLACGDARMRLYNVCLLCSFAGILACRRCTHRRYRVVGVSIYLCRDAYLRLGKPAGLHQQRFSRHLACGDARMRLYSVCLLCSFAGILACRRCTHRRYRVVGFQSIFVETHICVSANRQACVNNAFQDTLLAETQECVSTMSACYAPLQASLLADNVHIAATGLWGFNLSL